jgi:choline dehydrogenase-like flavoprotein
MQYDAVVVGGGLGGSALADQLARAGRSVLVLEREARFRDRVRGENMLPWGVAAAGWGLLQFLGPAQTRMRTSPQTLAASLADKGLPAAFSSAAFRRALLNIFHPVLRRPHRAGHCLRR